LQLKIQPLEVHFCFFIICLKDNFFTSKGQICEAKQKGIMEAEWSVRKAYGLVGKCLLAQAKEGHPADNDPTNGLSIERADIFNA
jgi:hypothetical protein